MGVIQAPNKLLSGSLDIRDSMSDQRLNILWAVSLWYNGVPVQQGEKTYYIGRDKPPSLKTLLGCSDREWERWYKPEFRKLKSEGAFTEKTILRRKIEWAPSENLLKLTGELFGDHLSDLVAPSDSFNSRKGHVGDWHESLVHRTGVSLATSLSWDEGLEPCPYPGEPGQERPDLYAYSPAAASDHLPFRRWGIEVITDHNDRKMLERKYNNFARDQCPYLWIFENRAQAAKALNYLSQHPEIDCSIKNMPVSETGQYSTKTLNKYIKKSKKKDQYCCYGINSVHTITGIHDNKLARLTGHNPAAIPGSPRSVIDSEQGRTWYFA